jgi:pyruvate formate lyase activating enzyme
VSAPARYYSLLPAGDVRCELCPRYCRLRAGRRGFCFVRQNNGGLLELTAYGHPSGLHADPVEKKPLFHFLPGSQVLSFGTAGCNLACEFCQNWELSTAQDFARMAVAAAPEEVARAAVQSGCASVAYTYNDPVVFAEYAIDTAAASRERGLANVAVTAGYINPEPRAEFFAAMDAANIDLKSFSPSFYRKLTGARLQPVLDTLEYVARETDVWLEVTTLLIPGYNDSDAELGELSAWIAGHLGPEVPLHFTAFHPAHRMRGVARTPAATLARARQIALSNGLEHVYTGNVRDPEGANTYCPGCGAMLIARDWHAVTANRLNAGRCPDCGRQLAGVF